jgi:ribonuclease J
MLKIIPLGGLGEIGLNMMVFEYGGTIFVIDAGLMFPEDYMLGVDFVIPDIDYLRQNQSSIAGIVLTHAHEDPIGARPYLLKEIRAPVFGTPFTLGLVRQKLDEYELIASAALHSIEIRSLCFRVYSGRAQRYRRCGDCHSDPLGKIYSYR